MAQIERVDWAAVGRRLDEAHAARERAADASKAAGYADEEELAYEAAADRLFDVIEQIDATPCASADGWRVKRRAVQIRNEGDTVDPSMASLLRDLRIEYHT